MNNKYVIGFMAVFFQLIGQTLMKGGLGYVEGGERVIPEWAARLGATQVDLEFDLLELHLLWEVIITDILTNIPLLVGFFFVVLYGLSIIILASKAGLVFVNSMLMIFLALISFVSFLLFGEYFGELKLTGMLVIVTGFILVIAGERQGENKGYIE